MSPEVELNELADVLEALSYPIDRDEARVAVDDITLVLADGTENLGAVVSQSSADRFETLDDLQSEIMSLLPRRAVGEPYQSEGEG